MSTETIREFFLKAPPHTNDPNQLWKIMRRECLRWHTDHIAKTCPGAEKDMKLVDLFKMVTQAVVEVRQKAGSERASRL